MTLVSRLAVAITLAGGVVVQLAGSIPSGPGHEAKPRGLQNTAALSVSNEKLLGQRIMVGLPGTTADPSLLDRIRKGRVGSVILFAQNISSRSQLIALTRSMQRASRQGGNPPLLIAVDQEGGQVKRLPNGPPDLSPPQIARRGSTKVASEEGTATGRYLKKLGINWDLAPVLDVPTFSGAFIWQQGRAFSFHASTVAKYATPFALGLQREHVGATGKHFPGVGSAAVDTDNKLDELRPTRAQRRAALVPYRKLIGKGLESVMVSTAGFPAYDRSGAPAALSRQIIQGVLRGKLKFKGVTITDDLGTPTGHDEKTAGVLAARAGADVLLYTDSAPGELGALEQALHRGKLSRSEAEASYQRIVALKRRLA
jgi:beta-N-acetylhexosaminidase